ncbi:hypothetical protein PIB30_091713, partial [Stylosanthes scabra]|nr:hypothetical protein [Stylosanthes scabra]
MQNGRIKMYSESKDNIDRPNGPKPKYLDSRCSPNSINDIFVTLSNQNIKLEKIDKMRFGGLKCIPKWSVDQESYLYLAENFNLTRNYIRTDVDDSTMNAAIIGRALDLPSHGLEFPTLDKKIPHHDAICSRWGGSTNVKLRKFIETCPMETHVQKMEFMQAFILLIVKVFFCSTSTAKISPNKHLPTILDVKNAMAYNWSFHILDWVKDAIANFQHNVVKHISGCMYALLILYFQRIRHGPLEQCTIEPPWTRDCDDMEEGEDDPLDKKSGTKKKESHKKKRKEGEDDVTFDKTEEIHVENEEISDDGQNKDEIVPHIQTWTELAEEVKGQMKKHNAVKERWKEIEEIINNDPNCNSYGEFNSSESPGRPSFSLGFSQDSKSPTPSRNPIEEILKIPPVSHILPIENPIAIMLSKGLSEAETNKIYSRASRQES